MNIYQFIKQIQQPRQFTFGEAKTPNVVSSGILLSHINGFDHPHNTLSFDGGPSPDNPPSPSFSASLTPHSGLVATPKYTFLTDINSDRERELEENRPLCSAANSLLSTNLESNLGDNQSTDINVSICLFRKNKHKIITDIGNDDLQYPMRTNEQTLELEYLSYYMDNKNDNQFLYETPNVVSPRIPQSSYETPNVVSPRIPQSSYETPNVVSPGIPHFGFPSFTYQLDNYRVQEEDDEDVDPFKEACIEHIMKLFSMEHIKHSRHKNNKHHTQKHNTKRNYPNTNSIDFGYHGMIRHENSVFVFFDMSVIELSFLTSPTHYETHSAVWAVVDEIVRKHSVFHIPIDPTIVDLFDKNPMLWNISHEGTTLSFPRAMYSVVPSGFDNRHIDADDIDALYENVETPDYKTATYTTTRKSKPSIISAPILPFAHSDLFAERFLFTDKPIPSVNSIPHFENGLPTYKRFVVFIYNPKFLFSEKFKSHRKWINDYPQNFVENMDEEDDETIESYRSIPCICFSQKLQHHKPVEIWGVIHDDLFSEIATA